MTDTGGRSEPLVGKGAQSKERKMRTVQPEVTNHSNTRERNSVPKRSLAWNRRIAEPFFRLTAEK